MYAPTATGGGQHDKSGNERQRQVNYFRECVRQHTSLVEHTLLFCVWFLIAKMGEVSSDSMHWFEAEDGASVLLASCLPRVFITR